VIGGDWATGGWRRATGDGRRATGDGRRATGEEKFGLIAQLRRAAVAIPSNIAEGRNRLGSAEFRRFVSIARGSVAEVETQLAVAVGLGFVGADEIESLSSRLDELSKMLLGLYRRLVP
jgi:four helix bundle protein